MLEGLQSSSLGFRFETVPAGAEHYRRTGVALSDETRTACREGDAILLGAAGLPDVLYPDGTEAGQDVTLQTRVDLDPPTFVKRRSWRGVSIFVFTPPRQVAFFILGGADPALRFRRPCPGS